MTMVQEVLQRLRQRSGLGACGEGLGKIDQDTYIPGPQISQDEI